MARPGPTVLGFLIRAQAAWLLALGSVLWAGAPGNSPAPDFAQTGLPDPADASAFLDRFRQAEGADPTYLEFDLHSLPRRGEETVFRGRLWTSRNEQGPISRIELKDAGGQAHAILLQSGPQAGVWTIGPTGPAQVGVEALFTPLVPGVDMTAFDLQMPFFYWPHDPTVRVTRMRGRPAYLFIFRPPAAFKAAHPDLAGVRAYLDTQYAAPVQTELFGASNRSTKTLSLVDLKKVGEIWTVKTVDVRDEATRDKTRFSVTGISTGNNFPEGLFSPESMSQAFPRGDRFVKIDP